MEMWDLYDGERQSLFRTHCRSKMMKPGEFHTIVDVWTVNSNKNILVTLRAPEKECYPNKWENTGGSALSGESSKQAAIRELMEETGILASQDELVLLDTYKDYEECGFADIYLLHCDISISNLTMQEGETVDAKWVTRVELERMIVDKSLAVPVGIKFDYVKEKFLRYLDGL